MGLSLSQSIRCVQEIRLALLCSVCDRDVPDTNGLLWLLDGDRDKAEDCFPEAAEAGIFDAYAWKMENNPTELEWFLWKVGHGYCPQCCTQICSGQLPDEYLAKWIEVEERKLFATYEEVREDGIPTVGKE